MPETSQTLEFPGALNITWTHPEYGEYHLRPARRAKDNFEILYIDLLRKLLIRKWDKLMLRSSRPAITRLELIQEQDLDPNCPFAPVQGALINLTDAPAWRKNPQWFALLEKSLAVNKCMILDLNDGRFAVSPFFEWELAEFWEGGYYDRDK